MGNVDDWVNDLFTKARPSLDIYKSQCKQRINHLKTEYDLLVEHHTSQTAEIEELQQRVEKAQNRFESLSETILTRKKELEFICNQLQDALKQKLKHYQAMIQLDVVAEALDAFDLYSLDSVSEQEAKIVENSHSYKEAFYKGSCDVLQEIQGVLDNSGELSTDIANQKSSKIEFTRKKENLLQYLQEDKKKAVSPEISKKATQEVITQLLALDDDIYERGISKALDQFADDISFEKSMRLLAPQELPQTI